MELKRIKKNVLIENTKIVEALKILNTTPIKIIFILNKKKELVGSITDGDLRRAFLKGFHTNDKVNCAMKKKPKFIYYNQTTNEKLIKNFFSKKGIDKLPVINKKKKLINILLSSELNAYKPVQKNAFVIMAGDFGKRLRPLTNNTPKPMIKIRNKPIMQYIIENAASLGFCNFYVSVNYLKNKIEKYFGNGSKFGVNITYIKESKPLGTAGSLSLLKNTSNLPIIVVNGDTVTDINFKSLINYHNKNNSQFTIVTNLERKKRQIGVIETKSNRVVKIIEKPVVTTKINTGIYVMNKKLIKLIKKNAFFNMTDLIKKIIKNNKKIISFPIYENWEDLGTISNLNNARRKK